MRTIVHVSDLHFGRTRPDLLHPLLESIREAKPDLVAVSGDLTQRARAGQFAQARQFIAALPKPVLVVPGNHDVPLDEAWVRLFTPWRRYRNWVSRNLEPRFEDEELVVIGLNTVAPFQWQRGWIAGRTVRRACILFGSAGERIRVLVTHHPFIHAPGQVKAVMRGASRAIGTFAECGVDIVLSGHLHSWGAEPYRRIGRGVVLVQAGTGLSTRLRGESNDFNVLQVGRNALTVRRFATQRDEASFVCIEQKHFLRTDEGWSAPQADLPREDVPVGSV